jgi:hypothetical protein
VVAPPDDFELLFFDPPLLAINQSPRSNMLTVVEHWKCISVTRIDDSEQMVPDCLSGTRYRANVVDQERADEAARFNECR